MQTPSKSIWPDKAPFALFLSHDVDQIHDREVFHFLASVNHIRRMLMNGEPGNLKLALKRLVRIVFAPKPPLQDFETILAIERKHAFRSTFFILHDICASKNGPRYRLDDPALHQIVERIQATNGEIGLHGGVKCVNDAAKYRQCREDLNAAFNGIIVGIRNHLLRHDGAVTWQTQQHAGFTYDATFGHAHQCGTRNEQFSPFYVETDSRQQTADRRPLTTLESPHTVRGYKEVPHCSATLRVAGSAAHSAALQPTANSQPTTNNRLLVIPLTVMDCTLFRSMKLSGDAALDAAWKAITPVIEAGGLVSLLWHNNYFNEPEYADWQWVYERLLERLALSLIHI